MARQSGPHSGGERLMRSLRGSYRPWLALFTSLLMCSGCGGGGKQPKPVPVTGQVLLEGKPLARARVTLVPLGELPTDLPRPAATADDQGRFALSTFSRSDGAPEGEYVALV